MPEPNVKLKVTAAALASTKKLKLTLTSDEVSVFTAFAIKLF